ncbi:hypothetical protein OEZ85_000299 [Tetradesmus obliquus]|uniref:Uncharacterized protein n=1 Tax=Tetradesmus obliquus TaxID=3088 RepID=A0ABY8UR51_TETOB|nr:hypothetical protein OEZ85_000299 [Tetradesmus obliquus]
MRRIDLGHNKLSGMFPLSWERLYDHVWYVGVEGNVDLGGCLPLSAFTTIKYAGTKMTGLCADSTGMETNGIAATFKHYRQPFNRSVAVTVG